MHGAAARLGVKVPRSVAAMIASYTIEGRKAVQIVADAYGHALDRARPAANTRKPRVPIAEGDVLRGRASRAAGATTPVRAREGREIGKTFGLGVLHHFGSIIEIEAVAFPAAQPGKGTVRFNETAGSMAKD